MLIQLYNPYKQQAEILAALDDPSVSYVCTNAGRQVGKSTTALNWLFLKLINKEKSVGIYMSRWYRQLTKVFKNFTDYFGECPIVDKVNKSEFIITLKNGSTLKFYSAQNADAVRGETIDYLVMDEFSIYPNTVFNECVRPALATRPNAKTFIISTPRGKGEWYNLFNRGLSKDFPKWKSFTLSSWDSPYIDREFLEDFKNTVSEKIYRQEILAEFIDDAGALFENIRSNILRTQAKPTNYNFAGIDIGFKNDYTILTVVNQNNEILETLRFNDETCNFLTAAKRIHDVLKKYNWPLTYIEINKWDSVYTYLKELNTPNLHTLVTSSGNKNQMIENLINLFKLNDIKITDDEVLIKELEVFEYEYNIRTKNISYSAPEGLHDDHVMSLAITFWAKKQLKPFSF